MKCPCCNEIHPNPDRKLVHMAGGRPDGLLEAHYNDGSIEVVAPPGWRYRGKQGVLCGKELVLGGMNSAPQFCTLGKGHDGGCA